MATTKENKPEIKFPTLEQQVVAVVAKVDMLVEEAKQQREDIRAANAKIDTEMKAARAKHDADMKEINAKIDSKFDKLSSQIQSLTIAAVVGIGAIVIGGGVLGSVKQIV